VSYLCNVGILSTSVMGAHYRVGQWGHGNATSANLHCLKVEHVFIFKM